MMSGTGFVTPARKGLPGRVGVPVRTWIFQRWLGGKVPHRVIPAKAGTSVCDGAMAKKTGVPAFAGMTPWVAALL
jgi:hypothetical protein